MTHGWISVVAAALMNCGLVSAKDSAELELARRLANESTRAAAVAAIAASPETWLPHLLSWTQRAPNQVDRHTLRIGLADAFGQLRAKEAIPFLIANISLQRGRDVNTWLKSAKVVEERLPAAAALVRIGPDAAAAVIRASWGPMMPEDRIAAVFVVSRIKGVPGARDFLFSAVAEARSEKYWAEEGLKRIDGEQAAEK